MYWKCVDRGGCGHGIGWGEQGVDRWWVWHLSRPCPIVCWALDVLGLCGGGGGSLFFLGCLGCRCATVCSAGSPP